MVYLPGSDDQQIAKENCGAEHRFGYLPVSLLLPGVFFLPHIHAARYDIGNRIKPCVYPADRLNPVRLDAFNPEPIRMQLVT